jgi:tRNA pseudouridine38-40 synthase
MPCAVARRSRRYAQSMRLRLDIGYDGTDFHGWATQPGLRTVQGELEAALQVLVRAPSGAEPRLTVGGRTDAGVHARGQVAHLDVADSRVSAVTARRINSVLSAQHGAWQRDTRTDIVSSPKKRAAADAVVYSVHEAPAAFDARFGALSRRYEYRLRGIDSRRDPLTARFTAEVPRHLDFDAMQRASEQLLGLQDFTTFCKAREGATAVRDLQRFDWRIADDGAYAATIEADAFCHSMVRALVGSVVAVGSERITRDELIHLRDARTRTSRFAVMPAHGLSLEEIVYPEDRELAARAEQTRGRREALPQ